MKLGSSLSISSNIVNITIFIYFISTLYKIGSLDMIGVLISGFGILISLIANIVGALE